MRSGIAMIKKCPAQAGQRFFTARAGFGTIEVGKNYLPQVKIIIAAITKIIAPTIKLPCTLSS